MRKYLRIYKTFLENAVSYDAQYRKDTWLHFFTNILWLVLLATVIEVIFGHTQAIAGWRKEDVYLLTVIWVMIDELYTMFFKKNMLDLSNKVTDGDLDYMLTKPVSSLFLISTPIFLMRSFYRFLVQFFILIWLVLQFDFAASAYLIPLTIIMIILGAVVHYAFTLILNTFSFWFLRIDNVNDLWNSVNGIGKYPLGVFPKFIKILAFTLFPIFFIGYGQVATLTGRWEIDLILYSIIFTVLLFLLARWFWYFAVRNYSSASS